MAYSKMKAYEIQEIKDQIYIFRIRSKSQRTDRIRYNQRGAGDPDKGCNYNNGKGKG